MFVRMACLNLMIPEVKKISASVPWGKNEELDFRKAEEISDEKLLVYYAGLNGNKSHMRMDEIDLEKKED